jgi:hypothetical protein
VKKATLRTILGDAMKGLGTLELPEEVLDEIIVETFKSLTRFQSGGPTDETSVITYD